MQRCPGCGQVFKLVRLRDEYSAEMDYYTSNFLPYEMKEMIEMDTTILMNPFKMTTHYEPTHFETPSNSIYRLVNSDDHDKILTDPAYRLQKTKEAEEIFRSYNSSLNFIDKMYIEKYGPPPRKPINKVDYETLIEVEKAIMKLDRNFRRVDRFNNRKFLDLANHDRRQKRMEERKKLRWDAGYSVFYGGLTEEEQMSNDYFETDFEKNNHYEMVEEIKDEMDLFEDGDYKFNKFTTFF